MWSDPSEVVYFGKTWQLAIDAVTSSKCENGAERYLSTVPMLRLVHHTQCLLHCPVMLLGALTEIVYEVKPSNDVSPFLVMLSKSL